MATDAQIEANRNNAAASTGPKTPEGKSISSGNAVSHGLFSSRDILHPDEASEFNQLAEAMQHDLTPKGALEQTLAEEIIRAAFRLRRCARVEDSLTGDTDVDAPALIAVDRARLAAHRILKRSMDELRRLQNERQFRVEVLPEEFNTDDLGLASYKDLMPAMAAEKRWQLLKRQLEGLGSFESMIATAVGPQPAEMTKRTQSVPEHPEIDSTKRTQSLPNTPRNAPCPCGSGQKHKRCCGKNAAPVLYSAAA